MATPKLIKDLITWTEPTQKHWIEVQKDDENETKKAELDWRVLQSMGIINTNLAINGSSTVRYSQIPLGDGRFLITVTANIAPQTNNLFTNTSIPAGLRPTYLVEIRNYFGEGSFPNIALREDRKTMTELIVYGDNATGAFGATPGRVRILNQHTVERTLSVTYISNIA